MAPGPKVVYAVSRSDTARIKIPCDLSTAQSVYLSCSLTFEVTLCAWAHNMNEYVKLNFTVSKNVTLRILVHTNFAGKVNAPILNVEEYSSYLRNK